MNFPTLLNTRRRMTALAVAALAGVGVANAQYTGIGTTAPDATLHVVPVTAGQEPLRVESVIDYDGADAAFSDVLLYDPTTGIFRRESLNDLFNAQGEWDFDGTTLNPANLNATTVQITNAGVAIGVPTSITGATDITGTLNVSGVTTLGTINQGTIPVVGTARVLISDGGEIKYNTLDEIFADNGQWEDNAGTLSPTNYPNTVDITTTSVGIGQATTVNNSLTVTGATTLDDAAVNGTLTLGPLTPLTAPLPPPADTRVLIQNATTGAVETYTIGDLVASNGEWILNAAGTAIEPRRYAGAATINATSANFGAGVATTIQSTLAVGGTTTLGDVANHATPIGTDKVLVQQDGSDLVEHVTIDDLIAANGEFYFNAATNRTESRRFADVITFDADDVVIAEATSVGSTLNVAGATALATSVSVGTSATIGTSATVGTSLAVGGAATIGGAATVAGTATIGGTITLNTVPPYTVSPIGTDKILFQQDGDQLVQSVTVDELLSANGEWVYDAANARIYARRANANGAEVWVTDAGDHVVEIGAAYQFGSNANQITASATQLDITAASDVSFNEGAETWMFYDADANGNDATERGRVGINTTAPQATLHVAGNIVASNTTVTSDKRFKKDINELQGALKAINALRGVSYEFRGEEFPTENFDEATHLGFIAQEIREVLPQTVFERADGFLTVDYSAVTPVLVEAVQELSAQVAKLQAENTDLRGTSTADASAVSAKQISELEARLADMDARLEAVVAGRK